jgi:metal-responsive CopG/Arc/MetJ family transcriptional regulator
MAPRTVRTILALPADLVRSIDRIVQEGRVRSRNELVAAVIPRELAAQERAAIDAAFAGMADDAEYRAESAQLDREFAVANWEAFRHAESEQ